MSDPYTAPTEQAPPEQASPDQPTPTAWPPCFLDTDIQIMQAVDIALAGVVAQAADTLRQIAWGNRQAMHDAILVARGGVRVN